MIRSFLTNQNVFIFMKLSRVITRGSQWAQNCDALTKDGQRAYVNEHRLDEQPRPKDFKAYSLYGAIAIFEPYERGDDINPARDKHMSKLRRAIEQVTGKCYSVAEFNNRIDTTFEQVEKVIKLSEKL